MKTVIIGGGKGCQALLDLAKGAFLKELTLDIECVMDLDPGAPGMATAREHGIRTTTDMESAFSLDGLEIVIELTGKDAVLNEIQRRLPKGAKLIDHTFAHVFWDLVNAQAAQKRQLDEKTELERKLEKERRYIQSLFDSIPDLVIVLDRDKTVLRTNARFTEFTGISSSEAAGKKCYEVFKNTALAIDCLSTSCPFEKVFSTGVAGNFVHQAVSPEEAFWEVAQTPIKNEEGEIEKIVETWHRITEKVMLRREIEHAEERFRRFIDAANDHINIKDLEGRYVVVNEATAKAYNRKQEDFIGKKAEEILPRGIAMIVNHHDQEVIRRNRHFTYEEVFDIEGRDRHFHTVRFPLPDYKGDPIGVCTIARDISMRKQLQDQLVQSAKLAAVGKLAAGVAHEINNPLTGILAFSDDMLDEVDEDHVFHKDLQVIIRETLRCREIVRNLLDFARQDAPQFEEIHLDDIVEQTLSLVERLPRFKDIVIEKNPGAGVPKVQVDPRQIQQVVLNLMLNAVDAMENKGKIILTTEYDRKHDQCIILVEDTGPGIPENLIDKVFEPFFSSKGTSGLGLAVSWGIVERHRGVIEVDTAESGGAIFRIILPAHTEFVR